MINVEEASDQPRLDAARRKADGPTRQVLFSGISESEAQKLWRQGITLAALSLAQSASAQSRLQDCDDA